MCISIYLNPKSPENNSPETSEKREKQLTENQKKLNTEISAKWGSVFIYL